LQDKKEKKDNFSIEFSAVSTPLLNENFNRQLNVHEFVKKGGEFNSGWSHIEPWGIWSDGEIADIYINVGEGKKFNVFLDANAFVSKERQYLEVKFKCGVSDAFPIIFKQGDSKSIKLKCEKSISHKFLKINIIIIKPTSPFADGQSVDKRLLGVGLTGIKVEKVF
jgi:hypothetical protein